MAKSLGRRDGSRCWRTAPPLITRSAKRANGQEHWQWVCKLILAKEDVLTVSRALELALFYDAEFDVADR